MSAAQFVPQDYGHPDRNIDEAGYAPSPEDQQTDGSDSENPAEFSGNERSDTEESPEGDGGSPSPGDAD